MNLSYDEAIRFYADVWNQGWEAIASLALEDRYFLLTHVCNRQDALHPWLYERCKEVEQAPDDHLDLWAREHYKSTVITFAGAIQEILRDPEITIGIFSFNNNTANKFLKQIKREFEDNRTLKTCFPHILWDQPSKQAPSWSEQNGIIVKRKTNPKEATIEAHGLVDGMPTGAHYGLRIYDDVITEEFARSPEMIEKATNAWRLSQNLGKRGGKMWHVGTRYHFNDTYKFIMDEKILEPRIYPATEDGTVSGKPVLLTQAEVDKKRKELGPYIFSCFPQDAPVLMADGTEKRIKDVVVGDYVVGYTVGSPKNRGRFGPTKVLSTRVGDKTLMIRAKFDDGRVVRCTPDHKWFTNRVESGRKLYSHLSLKPTSGIKKLVTMYIPGQCPDPRSAAYLGGIFDGEGSSAGKSIVISQSPEHNPEVCAEIEASFKAMGMAYGKSDIEKRGIHKQGRSYYVKGGRKAKLDFIRWCRPAKRQKLMDHLIFVRRGTDETKLVSLKDDGVDVPYNIQTETGNYIAYGALSKNCQQLQDPVADNKQGFDRKWVRHYSENVGSVNKYLLCDPASEKKKTSDYTVFMVVGLGYDRNYYLLDMVRDRLNLTERAQKLFQLHRTHHPIGVGYEKYGKDSDIQHFESVMATQNYRFDITPLGGQLKKEDRIRKLVPLFETGRVYLPEVLYYTDYEGKKRELVREFVEQEYMGFPVATHDDMLDCLARILDKDFTTYWPQGGEDDEAPKRDRYSDKPTRTTSWMAA